MADVSGLRGRRPYPLQRELAIDTLFTFHYYELPARLHTRNGERHPFWELTYVDKGEIEVFADDRQFVLTQGELALYHPNMHHRLVVKQSANLIIASFDTTAPCMSALVHQRFRLTKDEQFILTEMLKEAFEAFDPPITTLFQPYLGKNGQSAFGCEHLIASYLEILLLKLIRRVRSTESAVDTRPLVTNLNAAEGDLLNAIVAYMKCSLSEHLSLDAISERFHMSKTRLKQLFKQTIGIGIIHYFSLLKIEEAKAMIRDKACTYTEIAERLGYSSTHYFFTVFKKTTGMTPTEYARTVHSKLQPYMKSAK